MCDKRDIVGKVRQKGLEEIGMTKEMNLRIRGVDFSTSQICCHDGTFFRNIFLFELEREKVRSEVWRREEELMQDIRGATIGGSFFVFSQDNPDQVPSGNLTSIWHSDTPLIYTLHTSKWHTDCQIFLFLSRSLLSVSYLSFSSPSSPFLSLWWGFEGCGRASGFDNTDLYHPHLQFRSKQPRLSSRLLTVSSSVFFPPVFTLEFKEKSTLYTSVEVETRGWHSVVRGPQLVRCVTISGHKTKCPKGFKSTCSAKL